MGIKILCILFSASGAIERTYRWGFAGFRCEKTASIAESTMWMRVDEGGWAMGVCAFEITVGHGPSMSGNTINLP